MRKSTFLYQVNRLRDKEKNMKLSDFDLDMIRNSRVQINESMLTESDVYKLFLDSILKVKDNRSRRWLFVSIGFRT